MRQSLRRFGLKSTSAIYAVVIHVVVAALLFANLDFFKSSKPQTISVTPIQSALISEEDLLAAEKRLDQKDLEKKEELAEFEKKKEELELAKKREREELERIKQERIEEERKADEAEARAIEAEKLRKEEEIARVKEDQRLLDEKKKKREADEILKKEEAKKEQERKKQEDEKRKKEDAEKKRLAAEKAKAEKEKKEAADKKKREDDARKKKELAEKQQREKEMRERLDEEQRARVKGEAVQAFIGAQGAIQRKVSNNWIQPTGTRFGLKAKLVVKVAPNGEVINVVIRQSSGDPIFDRSVQNAILKASPLPIPKNPQYYPHYSEFVFNFDPGNS